MVQKINKILGSIIAFVFFCIAIYLIFPLKAKMYQHDYGSWKAGNVQHILPCFDHEKILVKTSFKTNQKEIPVLRINDFLVQGQKNDVNGRFWQFYFAELQPNTNYTLQIINQNGDAITSPWQIKSFPSPKLKADSLKVLAYTCAGGVETNFFNKEIFVAMQARIKLLKRGLEDNPQMVIANGDHIYWDQKSLKISFLKKLLSFRNDRKFGTLDLNKSMLDEENFETFTAITDAQIANLYGCELREKSVYFLADDHNLLENDEALPDLVTFPPKEYMLDAARQTQLLYYPEFLSDTTKSGYLSDYVSRDHKFATSFGVAHFGQLAEFDFFDAKRFLTLKGENAVLLPLSAENWLKSRSEKSSAKWLFTVPSTPFGWTAGKWTEWYSDVLDEKGIMQASGKYLWQKGWWNQHQRIIEFMSKQKQIPIILQGDLHISAYGLLKNSGNISLNARPIHLIGTGTLGTGSLGFPSYIRGTAAKIPHNLQVTELLKPLEKNGFTLLNITKNSCKIDQYVWRPKNGEDAIANLKPTFSNEIKAIKTAPKSKK